MRASYKHAIEWIALNDDQDIGSEGGWIISIHLVADLFGKPSDTVAADVIKYRSKL